MSSDLRALVAEEIRVHPRVAYQGLFSGESAAAKLAVALPPLPCFRKEYAGAITIVDWDHKLPSQTLALRVFGYYSDDTLEAGLEAYDDRLEVIAERDRYPEFDVPDFDQLAADEAYEIELSPSGTIGRCRLTSAWRRTIAASDAAAAVALAAKSADYEKLVASTINRPSYLGELEAVSWTPPCETQHGRWTLDVWYLLAFDGRVGTGRSFLIDLVDNLVVTSRDFSVRTG
ncbi:MAG: hypothetical protein IPH44_40715 [Myxococcales bacterium]|nr:hypothetical protein [Myxococcales bacterium]MBK7192366.1 hypothetical protein [Myxococcales bacterium]MBP6847560.1 hypothetical protein [Kofleriaceae bacterium]